MNSVVLVGRLTHNVEVKKTAQTSKSMASFQVATNEFRGGQKASEFHRCVAWDALADRMGSWGKKGRLVELQGRLQTREYEDRNGNKVKSTEINVGMLSFLDKDPDAEQQSPRSARQGVRELDQDDIPF
jgi:single-strand DNA-binding protein